MSAEARQISTSEEYLAFDRDAEIRHEFWDGEIVAMSGASRAHNLIAWNLAGRFHEQLRGRDCEAYVGDMRVEISASGSYAYPDLVVVCGDPRIEPRQGNPALIVEILSPSTEGNDRGRKLFAYRSNLTSLRVCSLIAQDRPWIEQWTRQENGRWLVTDFDDLSAEIDLSEVGVTLKVADVYDGVPLGEEPQPSRP